MASTSVVFYIWLALIVVGCAHVQAVPVESAPQDLASSGSIPANATTTEAINDSALNSTHAATDGQTQAQTQALESTATMPAQQENGNFDGAAAPDDQVASASHYDHSIYPGPYLPDAFQQYVNQFSAAYAPYAAAAYPAPVGYGPPPPAYHSPYSVQTGYEGYLVPSGSGDSTSSSSTTTNTAVDVSSPSALSTLLNPLTLIGSLFPAFMMSTLFRVIAAVVSMIGMVLFGGAITTAICNLTPICDISFKAVTYLKRRGTAQRVSRMIADEMTPERVRRATEFVRSAIRKYHDMQQEEGVAMNETY